MIDLDALERRRRLTGLWQGEDVAYVLLRDRLFWLRFRNGFIVSARDAEMPFSDDVNLWQASASEVKQS